LRIVPFFYCINEYNAKIIELVAEALHYIVLELNKRCKIVINRHCKADKSNIFDVRINHFEEIQNYENAEKEEGKRRYYIIMKNHSRKIWNLKKMHMEIMNFITTHMHVCIAKAFPLTLILQVFSVNFLIERDILEFLPLENICLCLNSQLSLVNVLKSAIEKGEEAFDDSIIDDFYLKTLKMGLYHFQKNYTYMEE
jgi:hypothetical protein